MIAFSDYDVTVADRLVKPAETERHIGILEKLGVPATQAEMNRRGMAILEHLSLNHDTRGRRYRRGKHRCKQCGGKVPQ